MLLFAVAIQARGLDRGFIGAHDLFEMKPFETDGVWSSISAFADTLWSPELERVCERASPESQREVFKRVGLTEEEFSCHGLVRAAYDTGETQVVLKLMTASAASKDIKPSPSVEAPSLFWMDSYYFNTDASYEPKRSTTPKPAVKDTDTRLSPELERVCEKASPESQREVFERVGLTADAFSCRGLARAAYGTGETQKVLNMMSNAYWERGGPKHRYTTETAVFVWLVAFFAIGGWIGWTLALVCKRHVDRQIKDTPCDVKIVTV
jgi:hypothetical protein